MKTRCNKILVKPNWEARQKGEDENEVEAKGIGQHAIRKNNLKELHKQMDKQMQDRVHRMKHAVMTKTPPDNGASSGLPGT